MNMLSPMLRETTPVDIIPMMIIGENDDVCVVGIMIVSSTLQIQAVQVDHINPLNPTDVDHHVIMMSEDHIHASRDRHTMRE